MPTSSASAGADPPAHANEVHLVGRLAVEPACRALPSGDVLVTFRLVVARASGRATASARRASGGSTAGRGSAPTVDTIDCAAWRKDVQRSLGRVAPGDVLQVDGALRRRFWRTGGGAASRSEVEVARVRRLARGG